MLIILYILTEKIFFISGMGVDPPPDKGHVH